MALQISIIDGYTCLYCILHYKKICHFLLSMVQHTVHVHDSIVDIQSQLVSASFIILGLLTLILIILNHGKRWPAKSHDSIPSA